MSQIDPIILEQLTAAVKNCRIPRADFEISYEDYLQSEELRVFSSSLDDDQIECLEEIGGRPPFPIVTFIGEEVRLRASALSRQRQTAESREWLHQRGMLDHLPLFDPKTEEPMAFAHRLEEFCGIEPGTVFEMNEQLNVITPNIDWIALPIRKGWLWRKLNGARHQEQFGCLMRVMSATNAEEHGVRFGFVGNAYVSDDQNQ